MRVLQKTLPLLRMLANKNLLRVGKLFRWKLANIGGQHAA